MANDSGRIKLAIQKSGRITEDSIALLKSCGFGLDFSSKALFTPAFDFPIDVLSLRDDDIPEYVQDGVSDLGIVGLNVVEEKQVHIEIVEHLGFAKCSLKICVPKESSINEVHQLKDKRIATTYPNTLRSFMNNLHIDAHIVEISGSVEIAPSLNIADAICDIVSTGTTAILHGLEPSFNVLNSEAVLISNIDALDDPIKRKNIDRFLFRIRSNLRAKSHRYVMMNVPNSLLKNLNHLVPAMKSPTVMPLNDPNMSAVHSVINKNELWNIIEQLKLAGASDIIISPIDHIIP